MPISLLPQISKILEKLFNRRLTEFLEKYKVISPTQYGFRENMSTYFALTELVDEITASLDNKLCTMGVSIYLIKCILFAADTSLFCSDANVNRLFE